MDAGDLSNLDTGAFGGVVDKGTIDAVLSGGSLDMARPICQEAMRVLEPGGTFLVVSNTPGEKLLETLLSMCGPGSACGSPLAVPTVGGAGPCVYAYIVRKKSPGNEKGEGGGVTYTGGQAHSTQQREGPNESDDAACVEAHTAEGARRANVGDAAPRSDSHVSDPQVPDGRSTLSEADGGFGDRSGGGGATDGLLTSSTHRGHERSLLESKSIELARQELARQAATYKELFERLQYLEKFEDFENNRRMANSEGTASRPNLEATGGAGRGGALDFDRRTQKALNNYRSTALGMANLPEQQPSLPWGAQESFSEDTSYATYELKFDTELSPSRLSVEIGATHVKACYRHKPDGLEVLLDRELCDKVTAESTWCIEDKTVLSFK